MFLQNYSKLLVILLLFSGCAIKRPTISQPVAFVFKTPNLKIAATGFLYKNAHIKLQGYSGANPIFTLLLTKRVCINDRCMSYKNFNQHFLSPAYPEKIVRNILLGRPIFHGQNLQKSALGFSQEIVGDSFAIIYRVEKKKIYFKDRRNVILIKIKELDG